MGSQGLSSIMLGMSTSAPIEVRSVPSTEVKEKAELYSFQKPQRRDWLTAMIVGAMCFALSAIYYHFDHHQLMMDESWHILKGHQYRELWSHFRPWNLNWWHQFMTVDGFYPLLVQAQSGFIKALFGSGRWADIFLSCSYNFLMGASLFLCVRMAGFSVLSGLASVFFINCFPETNQLNHMFMLDFPAMASTAFGIFLFFYWWANPTKKTAIACGLLLGLCSLTKHVAAVYLLGVGLMFAILSLMNKGLKPAREMFVQTAVVGLSAASLVIPWVILNRSRINYINNYAKEGLDAAGILPDFSSSFIYYAQSYWVTLSPVLCILAVFAALALKPKDNYKLLPFWCSFTVGFMLMSSYVYPMHRYILPSLILPAVLCGVLVDKLFSYKNWTVKACAIVLTALAAVQFLSFHFTPYPIANLPHLTDLSSQLGVHYESTKCGTDGTKGHPIPYSDWGYDWVSQVIEKTDKDPVYLNIMVNVSQLNAQTFDLLMKEKKSNIFATSQRVWTIAGDTIAFSPETALNYQWYLFKDGLTGLPLRDKESEKNYAAMKKFVAESGKFRLVREEKAPDNTALRLYRIL